MVRILLVLGSLLAAAWLEAQDIEPRGELAAPIAAENSESSHLVVVRLAPEAFASRNRDRGQIDETTPVSEVVLGTPAVGTSRVRGKIGIDFVPKQNSAGVWLTFSGTSVSCTVSRRRPVVIHGTDTTRFVGRKPITFDLDRGFRYGQAESHVELESTRRTVQSNVGGLRGRIVRRVAYRRLDALGNYLARVAEQSTKRRFEQSFDREADSRLAVLNTTFQTLRLALKAQAAQADQGVYDVALNTTDRYLQIGVGPKGAANPTLPDKGIAHSPVQVWIHASVFGDQALPLVENWRQLRQLLPPPPIVAVFRPDPDSAASVPLGPIQLTTAGSWVVITGTPPYERQRTARQAESGRRRF